MINKVYLITPYGSQYGALHHFTQKLYEAWVRAGFNAFYFTDADAALDAALRDPPDLMIGFNGVPSKDTKLYCDIIKRPYLTLLVDPFYRFLDLISSPYLIIGCDDFSSTTALKNMNVKNVIFVPHAVEADLVPDTASKKIYDVTMLATFIDHEACRESWKSKYPELVCKAMDEIIERTFFNPELSFTDAVMNVMRQTYQKHPELNSLKVDATSIFIDIEIFIKGKERVDMLRAIQSTPVHVFGHTADEMDWKTYFKDQSNIIVHDAVSYEESLNIMKQSKIILNSSIKNKFGAHERIFSGLAAGALVFTNENPYLKKFFMHDFDIVFYQSKKLNQIDSMICTYLANEEKRQQIVENGREVVMSFHTWDARIRTFKEELFPLVEKIQEKA